MTTSPLRTKRITVSAESHWRGSQDHAKDECNDILDRRVDDVIRREDHDGWELIGSRYSAYAIEHDPRWGSYKCKRSKILTFREYEQDSTASSVALSAEQLLEQELPESLQALVATEPFPDEDLIEILKQRVRSVVPATKRHPHKFLRNLEGVLIDVRFLDLRITESKLVLSNDLEHVGLPLNESSMTIPVNNCGSERIEIHRTLAYEYTQGYRIELTKTVTTRAEVTGSLTFSGGSLGGTVSREVSFSSTNEYSRSITERREEVVDIAVAPNKKVLIKLLAQQFEARRKFRGPITVDATIALDYGIPNRLWISRDKHRLSDILVRAEDRSHDAEGYYANLDTKVLPIDISETDC